MRVALGNFIATCWDIRIHAHPSYAIDFCSTQLLNVSWRACEGITLTFLSAAMRVVSCRAILVKTIYIRGIVLLCIARWAVIGRAFAFFGTAGVHVINATSLVLAEGRCSIVHMDKVI
jgi:hypothetical protein